MTRNYIFLLICLLALVSACENEIPLNSTAKQPKLVMNAFIDIDSINNRLYLNTTGQVLINQVTDATVEVRVNGNLVETARYVNPDIIQGHTIQQPYFLITTRFHPGETVRIDALTSDGTYHAWSESVVPQPIPIEKVDTASIFTINGDIYQSYEYLLRYKITFKDRPGERNFYRLILERQGIFCTTSNITGKDTLITRVNRQMIIKEDIVLTDGQPNTDNGMFEQSTNMYGVFDDTRFSNQEYTMTTYTNQGEWIFNYNDTYKWKKINVYVRLLSIDETTYYYLKALNTIYSDAYDETLMEPIRFASNVNGGIGIVSICSGSSKLIQLSD